MPACIRTWKKVPSRSCKVFPKARLGASQFEIKCISFTTPQDTPAVGLPHKPVKQHHIYIYICVCVCMCIYIYMIFFAVWSRLPQVLCKRLVSCYYVFMNSSCTAFPPVANPFRRLPLTLVSRPLTQLTVTPIHTTLPHGSFCHAAQVETWMKIGWSQPFPNKQTNKGRAQSTIGLQELPGQKLQPVVGKLPPCRENNPHKTP